MEWNASDEGDGGANCKSLTINIKVARYLASMVKTVLLFLIDIDQDLADYLYIRNAS